jgi:hypothetical protein
MGIMLLQISRVACPDDNKDILGLCTLEKMTMGKRFDPLELKARLLVGKVKSTAAYMRRSKMAGIVWNTSTNAARCARRVVASDVV